MSAERRGPGSDVEGPDDRVDRAIDRAVREMLDVEPAADLRARVIQRIDRGHGRRAPAGASLWWIGLAAAAAIILLALFVARPGAPGAPQAPVVAHGPDRRLPPEGTPPVAPEPSSSVRTPRLAAAPAPRQTPRGADVVAAANTLDNASSTTIAPLKTITPIEVTSISQDAIVPTEISVRPLTPIAEVQIAPLTPPDRRN